MTNDIAFNEFALTMIICVLMWAVAVAIITMYYAKGGIKTKSPKSPKEQARGKITREQAILDGSIMTIPPAFRSAPLKCLREEDKAKLAQDKEVQAAVLEELAKDYDFPAIRGPYIVLGGKTFYPSTQQMRGLFAETAARLREGRK